MPMMRPKTIIIMFVNNLKAEVDIVLETYNLGAYLYYYYYCF